MFDKPIGRSCFSFGYGIGIYSHNYHSNADFIYKLDSANKNVTTILQPKTIAYKTNSYNAQRNPANYSTGYYPLNRGDAPLNPGACVYCA